MNCVITCIMDNYIDVLPTALVEKTNALQIVNSPPRDFCVRKRLCIMDLRVCTCERKTYISPITVTTIIHSVFLKRKWLKISH